MVVVASSSSSVSGEGPRICVVLVTVPDEETGRALALDAVEAGLAERLAGEAAQGWRCASAGRLLECSLSAPAGLEHAVLVVRDVTETVHAEERLRDSESARVELQSRWLAQISGP